jgi:hypothetical protein
MIKAFACSSDDEQAAFINEALRSEREARRGRHEVR